MTVASRTHKHMREALKAPPSIPTPTYWPNRLANAACIKQGYFTRRPFLHPDPTRWTDAQFTTVKHFFATLEILKEDPMQRVFTLELRVDFKDKEKMDLVRTLMAQAAREVYAGSALLTDHIKPQVAIFSDDFFQTHEELSLLHGSEPSGSDSVEVGGAKVGLVSAHAPSPTTKAQALAPPQVGAAGGGAAEEETFSPELLAALR